MREGLSRLVNDIGNIDEESEKDIDADTIVKLINLLEQNLRRSACVEFLTDVEFICSILTATFSVFMTL